MPPEIAPPVDLTIRLRRAAFNSALAERNLDAIAPLLGQHAILVAGTDSAVIAGRKAQLLAWKHEFGAATRTIYVRTPATIVASPIEPIAFEHGHWQGVDAATGQHVTSGDYTAKWRRIAGDWVIEAELYLTLA